MENESPVHHSSPRTPSKSLLRVSSFNENSPNASPLSGITNSKKINDIGGKGSDASVKSLVDRKTPVRSPLSDRKSEPRYQIKTTFPERIRDDVFRDIPTQPSTPSQRRKVTPDHIKPALVKIQHQHPQEQQHNRFKSPSLELSNEKKNARRAKHRLLLEKRNQQRAALESERKITLEREEKLKEEQRRYEALRQKVSKDNLDGLKKKVTELETDTDESRKMVEEYAEVSQAAHQENEEKLDELSGRIINCSTLTMMVYEPAKRVSRSSSHYVGAPARPLMTQREQGLQAMLAERESQIMELEYALDQCRVANKAWEEEYDILKGHEHDLRTKMDSMMIAYAASLKRANEKIYRLAQECQRRKISTPSFESSSDDAYTRRSNGPKDEKKPVHHQTGHMNTDCLWVEQTVARQSLLRSVEDVIREIDLEIYELDQKAFKEEKTSVTDEHYSPSLCSHSMAPLNPGVPDVPVSPRLSASMWHPATTPPPKYSSPPPQPRQQPLAVHATRSTGAVVQHESRRPRKKQGELTVSRSKSQQALDTLFNRKKSQPSLAASVKSGTVHQSPSDEAMTDKKVHPSQQRRRRPLSECQTDKSTDTMSVVTTKKSKPVLRRMSIQAFMLSNKMVKN
ncbi:hypothetical protein BCR43DRAFT_522452 [Syncephalastrum racemosum]|uniref:Uncharacterized protein n=1 Tax=Syncephalastrum racemosum TaxID=13706 RepID=A0A1X2HQN8_SYNRA|nr:hypothetical protein BCR43DRAFT_522452 [Syncephalastrum racemosum]